jgi:translation initiation factor 2 subunit 3
LGEDVEIRPGIISKTPSGDTKVTPILTKIVTLQAERNNLIYAVPGGLIGIGLKVDPFLTRGDRLVGRVNIS